MHPASAVIAASVLSLRGFPGRGLLRALAMAAFLMLVSAVTAQPAAPSRQAVAVLPHTVVGSGDRAGAADWGFNLAVEIEAELTRSRRFLVVDRRQIEAILDEAWLRLGSLTTAQFQEYGELLGAGLFVDGTISVTSAGQLRINTRVVNARTGQVIEVRGANAFGPEAFANLAQEFGAWAAERFPLEGRIAAIDGQRAYIDLGAEAGVSAGDEGELLRDLVIADLTVTEAIGTFRVIRPSAAASLIEATLQPGIELRVGDRAQFQPPAPASPPPPVVTTGTVLVRGAPVGARVLLDGMEVGLVGVAGWVGPLPAGSVLVEVLAAGHEPFARQVEVPSDGLAEVDVNLPPSTPKVGSLLFTVLPAGAQVYVNDTPVGLGDVFLEGLAPGTYRYRVEAEGFTAVEGHATITAGAVTEQRVQLSQALSRRPGSSVAAVAAGGWSSLMLLDDGNVLTWGDNAHGQLGDGTTTTRHAPVRVGAVEGIARLAAGAFHSFGVRDDGSVWAWGENGSGQLGDGTTTSRSTPVRVRGLSSIVGVAAGYYHSLALDSNGSVWAWGYNIEGELGDGTTADRLTPVQVNGPTGIVGVAAGFRHSLAGGSDGTVWTWGANESGQLGDGTTTSRSTPVRVRGLNSIVGVAAGLHYSLALDSNGNVWAWGENGSGELGDGSTMNRSTPEMVTGLTQIKHVAAGIGHSLALAHDGTVWAWGDNGGVQLGDGTTTNRRYPVRVSGLTNIIGVAAGYVHSLALGTDGSLFAWGSNDSGQYGDGTTRSNLSPVRVNGWQ